METSKRINLSTGQTIDVWTVTGVVADDRHSSTTRTFSSGGGGYVGPHGGHVAAPRIHSETTTRQSVWIADNNGKDHELSLQNMEIPLRLGQRVTARFVLPAGTTEWRLATFTNHSADLFYSWADKSPPPFSLTATDRGSLLASVYVVGGAASCWYAWGQLTSRLPSSSIWFNLCGGLLLLGGLAVFTGIAMRLTRRSKLKEALRAEYIEAIQE